MWQPLLLTHHLTDLFTSTVYLMSQTPPGRRTPALLLQSKLGVWLQLLPGNHSLDVAVWLACGHENVILELDHSTQQNP